MVELVLLTYVRTVDELEKTFASLRAVGSFFAAKDSFNFFAGIVKISDLSKVRFRCHHSKKLHKKDKHRRGRTISSFTNRILLFLEKKGKAQMFSPLYVQCYEK